MQQETDNTTSNAIHRYNNFARAFRAADFPTTLYYLKLAIFTPEALELAINVLEVNPKVITNALTGPQENNNHRNR